MVIRLSNALSRQWIIADYLGIHPSEIWPSRYFDMYDRLIERRVRDKPQE
ncbi:hypothetical protein CKY10_15340 [Photorhabdus sp. HUG-39]|uniref:Ner winged helix-turn-helix DNA-binding domain-containing protein n=1 Tax=Photorhabdus kayaii TaxID=230088 RepID=A0ABX0B7H4_9GAMM|nr:helix-turn-helix domain-containing protein [Photorhabdus bodei]MCC8462966.1 helix-turn-helix domain-containing protein [Photorhabdus bodei]NDL13120.1 hypothetical protein [Photorhabdus kayaii]NDL26849.1 hypothetical protein [Photorhabdus kayaii]RAX08475.1 hypothetical protein CKY10_15340 [Photorhabdus sp. HUG-39]